MKILNMVIPILMHFGSSISILSSNEMWRYKWGQSISDSILQDILSQIFDVIQTDVALQKQVN